MKKSTKETDNNTINNIEEVLRPAAEVLYADELKALIEQDNKPKPANWAMSPWAVVQFLMGTQLEDGTEIEPKYFGNKRLIELAVATLATDRALLLIGVPGTAKSWVSENIAAAISGTSALLVQGTAGMSEDALRYGWNYAQLLSKGPSPEAIVASPIMNAMQLGKIARIEELTRIPADVQDTLITILSEKLLPVPELNIQIQAKRGFNVIATANDRDKGVNELSSALKRRFNTVQLPLPETLQEEVKIVKVRVEKMGKSLEIPAEMAPVKEIERLVVVFRELRNGRTIDGKMQLKVPSATLSTAEAISVINSGQAMAAHFGDGKLRAFDLASGILGAVIKDATNDSVIWKEYLETVIRDRLEWSDLYRAFKDLGV
jgi:MoxR-like ATPase